MGVRWGAVGGGVGLGCRLGRGGGGGMMETEGRCF